MKSTNLMMAGAFFVLGLVSVPSIVYSQSSEGRLDIEEIIVTGTKRDISQQDVPVAVSTLTAKQLDNTFRNDVFALGQLAPNVTLTPQNGFNAIAGGMRGTGFISILVTKDPSVGVCWAGQASCRCQATHRSCSARAGGFPRCQRRVPFARAR